MSHAEVLGRLIASWRRHDIDAVLPLLHEDLVWHYHVGSKPMRGRAGARRILEVLAQRQKEIGWRIFHLAEVGERLFVEGADVYTTPDGVRIEVPYMGILEFKDGLIIGWRDYVDSAVVARLEAGEARPDFLTALTSRASILG